MTRSQTAIGFLVVQSLAAAWVHAQTAPAPASASAPRYKVAYWFDRAWPVPTFRSQAYDVGKGEYDTQAVGRWLDLMATRHPGYAAYVRDVDAAPGRDALATAVERERRHVAEFGGPGRSAPAAVPGQAGHEAGPTPSRPAPEAGTRPAQRQVTNYIPIPDYAKLMHPTISGYDRPRPTRSSTLGGPLGGWRGFNYGQGFAPGSTGYPFPVPIPYPRPHP